MSPEETEKTLMGGANIAGGAAAVKGGAKGTAETVKQKLGKTPQAQTAKAGELMDKMANTSPEYSGKVQHAIERGHLPEIEKQFKPRTVKDAYNAVADYMDTFEEGYVKDVIRRHPGARISGNEVADAIEAGVKGDVEKFEPETAKVWQREAARYRGKEIGLEEAFERLKKLNARTKTLRKSPEAGAAIEKTNAKVDAFGRAADTLRQGLYGRLEQLGEPVKDFQTDYGSMREIASTLRKNIPRAQRIGKGPSYAEIAFKQHNPWYAILGGVGAGVETGSAGVGTAVALGVPFLQWTFARRGTPNAVVSRAMEAAGKTGFTPPSKTSPPPPKGLLGPGSTPLGPSDTPNRTTPPPPTDPSTTVQRKGRLLGPGATQLPAAPSTTPEGVFPAAKNVQRGKGGKMTRGFTTSPDPKAVEESIKSGKNSRVIEGKTSQVGTQRGATEDTAFFQMASETLGPDASVREKLAFAQALKDAYREQKK